MADIQLPSSPTPTDYVVMSVAPTVLSKALDARIYTRQTASQFYKMDVQYPPMAVDVAAPLIAKLEEASGRHHAILMPLLRPTKQTGLRAGSFARLEKQTGGAVYKLYRLIAVPQASRGMASFDKGNDSVAMPSGFQMFPMPRLSTWRYIYAATQFRGSLSEDTLETHYQANGLVTVSFTLEERIQ